MKCNLCLMFRMNVSSVEHQFTITLYTYAHNQDAHEMFSKTLQCNTEGVTRGGAGDPVEERR